MLYLLPSVPRRIANRRSDVSYRGTSPSVTKHAVVAQFEAPYLYPDVMEVDGQVLSPRWLTKVISHMKQKSERLNYPYSNNLVYESFI
jgi:hypothetical protein